MLTVTEIFILGRSGYIVAMFLVRLTPQLSLHSMGDTEDSLKMLTIIDRVQRLANRTTKMVECTCAA